MSISSEYEIMNWEFENEKDKIKNYSEKISQVQ
jgi:hypothetical protein